MLLPFRTTYTRLPHWPCDCVYITTKGLANNFLLSLLLVLPRSKLEQGWSCERCPRGKKAPRAAAGCLTNKNTRILLDAQSRLVYLVSEGGCIFEDWYEMWKSNSALRPVTVSELLVSSGSLRNSLTEWKERSKWKMCWKTGNDAVHSRTRKWNSNTNFITLWLR